MEKVNLTGPATFCHWQSVGPFPVSSTDYSIGEQKTKVNIVLLRFVNADEPLFCRHRSAAGTSITDVRASVLKNLYGGALSGTLKDLLGSFTAAKALGETEESSE